MERFCYSIILTMIILVFFIAPVNAAGTGVIAGNNDTVNASLASDIQSTISVQANVSGATGETQIPNPDLQDIDQQISFMEKASMAIHDKEEQLEVHPLEIHDEHDITDQASGFIIDNGTGSRGMTGSAPGYLRSEDSGSISSVTGNQLTQGSYIEFGSDGKTRVFSPDGNETAYAVDERTAQVTTPSGKVLPATHIIGMPNGATIHSRKEHIYITLDGEVILTIIDHSDLNRSDLNGPEPKGLTWVEYAESDPYYFLGQFSSSWEIPESPDLVRPNDQPPLAVKANIIFNGIEPSDGTMIFQPVTAFNLYEHSSLSGTTAQMSDPAIINKWTGASWFCPPNNSLCAHSPVISFNRGNFAEGSIEWIAPLLKWKVTLTNDNYLTSTTYYSDSYIVQNPYLQPFRTVVVYEWHPTLPNGGYPSYQYIIQNIYFNNLVVRDTNGLPITMNWHKMINQNDHKNATELDVQFLPSSVSPDTIILYTEDLKAGFASDALAGTSPFVVHFTDQSDGDPTAWVWDFNNDGIVDSTIENSEYTYTESGPYNVKLSVSRPGQSDDEIKSGYIVVNGLAVRSLPGIGSPPTDPDRDNRYEDLNANDRIDGSDYQLYFLDMDWIAANEPLSAFDFNNNGRIDGNDYQVLFGEL